LQRTETALTKNFYSQDSRHLTTRVEEANGLVTLYTYVPETNLIKTKVLCDGDIPKITYTYEYDEDFLLIKETVDDGICQKIKRIFPKQTQPFLGMPETVEEKYMDGGEEKLLKRKILHYRTGARIDYEEVYDAEGNFCYQISYEYDEKNRVIQQTNPIGQVTLAKYDALGNRCFYQDFGSLASEISEYDFSNRLIRKTVKDPEKERVFEYSYDTKHHLEWESDERGHKTYYKYNLLGQRIETILPPVQMETGKLITPTIRQEYDATGNEIARIDAEGHRTETKYNAYGKPTHVIHPNGLEEHFVYTLSGDLIRHIDVSGVETHYKYDYLCRILEKATFSLGKELAKETYSYVGHYLVSKTDAEGNATLYTYDKAGRKTSETFAGETTRYEFDALGRIFRFQQGAEITTRTFDLLDRILEEQHHSLDGELLKKTCYEYDSAGNKTATIFFTENGAFKEASVYDALNRVIEKTNTEGFKEKFTYEDILNEHGQKVLQKTHTDALGLQTIETLNTHGRTSKIEKEK
jgi:Rhs family protein